MALNCIEFGLVVRNVTSYLHNCYACAIFQIILVAPTILLNMALIMAIIKSSEWRVPCQMLIFHLAVADLATALISLPSLSVEFLYLANRKDPCFLANITLPLGYLISSVSFCNVIALAMERYMAVFYPYVHNIRLTRRTMALVLSCIWLWPTAYVVAFLFLDSSAFFNGLCLIAGLLAFIVIFYCYTKILLLTRSIRRQIHVEAARFGHGRISEKDKDLLFVGGLIIISFAICYLPIIMRCLVKLFDVNIEGFEYSLCWEWALGMARSLVNPVISCRFNPAIKRRIKKFFSCRQNNEQI